jgi:hypothetical protein
MAGAALEDRLQDEIEGVVSKNRDVFSAVLGLAHASGGFRWVGAAGTAYADSTEPMQNCTPICIASITKMYVAAATMILEERGLLSLDDPLSNNQLENQGRPFRLMMKVIQILADRIPRRTTQAQLGVSSDETT